MRLPPSLANLVRRAATALAAEGGPQLELREGRPDSAAPGAALVGAWQARPLDLPVQVRPSLVAADLERLVRGGADSLLVTRHVDRPLADALRAMGQDWLDGAGNVRLCRDDLLLWVEGRPAPALAEVEADGPGVGRKGLRVVFMLLTRPDLLNSSYRAMAAFAGVSVGTVHNSLAELEAAGWLRRDGQRRTLHRGAALQAAFLAVVDPLLRAPALALRCRVPEDLDWGGAAVQEALAAAPAWLGGAGAALRLLAGSEEPEPPPPGAPLDLWCAGDPAALAAALQLDADPAGTLLLRQAFWAGDLRQRPGRAVDPVLVLADLEACGDPESLGLAGRLAAAYPPLDDIG